MKISEMSFNQACDATVRLVDPIARITSDDRVEPLLKELASHQGESGANAIRIISSMLPRFVPMLLKDHRADLVEILAILGDKKSKDIEAMKLNDVIRLVRESLDEDIIGFFKSSVTVTGD
jgi:hypothetical protein